MAAGILCFSIEPIKSYLIPNNSAFVKMNADNGSTRSAKAAKDEVDEARPVGGAVYPARGGKVTSLRI